MGARDVRAIPEMTGNVHLDIVFSPAVREMQIRRKGREFVCLFTRNGTACKIYSSWCNIIKASWTEHGVRAAKLNKAEGKDEHLKTACFPPHNPKGGELNMGTLNLGLLGRPCSVETANQNAENELCTKEEKQSLLFGGWWKYETCWNC